MSRSPTPRSLQLEYHQISSPSHVYNAYTPSTPSTSLDSTQRKHPITWMDSCHHHHHGPSIIITVRKSIQEWILYHAIQDPIDFWLYWDPTDPYDIKLLQEYVGSNGSVVTYNPKCTHSPMETQCNQSQFPTLMKQNCTHNPSTSQVKKSNHTNPMALPYPPDPGEHVLQRSAAPTTLVERDKLDLSSLVPPKGEMESSFSWTCPFKSPTSSTLCFGEPTLGKLNQEIEFYMTKHMPKSSSGTKRVSD